MNLTPQISVGDTAACRRGALGMSVVHACKSPCHQNAVGYKGSLPPGHPQYLVMREERDLFLNMIDPPLPLFPVALFDAAIEFCEDQLGAGRELLIHCNNGLSRAPSLALILLARSRELPSGSYVEAVAAFRALCPTYAPGEGIRRFLDLSWARLMPSPAVPA